MNNKNLYIGLGVLAVAGIGFYMWRKKQGEVSETETKVAGKTETTPETTTPETKPEVKASAVGNVASNSGRFISNRFSPSRFSPSRNVVTKTDTLTANTDLQVGVGTARVAPRVAPIVAPNNIVTDSTKPYKGSTSGTWICPYFDEKDQVWKEAPCKMFTA